MLTIRKLLWDKRNIFHIAKHDIIPEGIEEACEQKPIVQRGVKKNRLILLGVTKENRLLNVILENHGVGNYYIVTAYDASPEDTKLYKRLKGGDNNEATEK
jgi:hypothetical protein